MVTNSSDFPSGEIGQLMILTLKYFTPACLTAYHLFFDGLTGVVRDY
jgi:uncharacterized protein (DUF3820 family)